MGKYNVGKPQRTKRHKKLKPLDPEKKGESQAKGKKKNVNERPKNPDEQEMPYSLKEVLRLRNNIKTKKKKRNAKFSHVNEDVKGSTKHVEPYPKFEQGAMETERAFFNRMDRVTQKTINKVKFEEKYQVDVEEQPDGKIEIRRRKSKAKLQRAKEKFEKKKVMMKKQKEKKVDDFGHLKDSVRFGEVAHAPPLLTVKPKKADVGGKKTLLLHGILQANKAQNPDAPLSSSTRQIGKTQKRKLMSMAQQMAMDAERNKAIELYRKMRRKPDVLELS